MKKFNNLGAWSYGVLPGVDLQYMYFKHLADGNYPPGVALYENGNKYLKVHGLVHTL